ncbi:GvpL/GvpF family gas vesicle protein [Dactylosporangium roseum]|uniref:GvpL/GvpF family gas vesicle protein n=1 Tax=Dactylosporangium roseum TaxID=47989 RepID=A0ABY5YX68_9ACTN|nr:GvpL/GvpF family gas vesicle protein [Dactylosporangium roseum]UWZ33994.1 GvpL/GvpF family gas vesicle protein [Dactylosporangium roseum]
MAGTGTLIYAFVPGDVEPTGSAQGVGDPPADVDTVTYDDVAALVSEIPLDRPLGRSADLRAYQRLLDGTATVSPVLPVRFGTVLTDRDAVRDLLTDQRDRIVPMLGRLDGRMQYMVHGRYVEPTILEEILDGSPEARQLREQLRGQPEDAFVDTRMRLGEIINTSIEALRDADMRFAVERLKPVTEDIVLREPTHELDAVNLAVLVDRQRHDEFDHALRELAGTWDGRVTLRRLGPSAPYDFVPQLAPEQ